MSDYDGPVHSDWCDLPLDENEECVTCNERQAEAMAEHLALYQPRYTREELMDVYSSPCDRHKLISLLGEER